TALLLRLLGAKRFERFLACLENRVSRGKAGELKNAGHFPVEGADGERTPFALEMASGEEKLPEPGAGDVFELLKIDHHGGLRVLFDQRRKRILEFFPVVGFDAAFDGQDLDVAVSQRMKGC